ncbi:MAG TPA: efflux RND transporter periplasmic adaptor subunit [Vicinamibacteria bacterium]|nr:efflux RND transporter periplasmic adaptor subunit [Vicinamibacteria bacterium]
MRRPTRNLPLLLAVTSVGLAGLAPGCGRGAAVEVEMGRVEKRAVFRSTVTASGEIVAERYADVGSSVMGKLVSLPVKEGDRVRKGQVVARIDSVPASSERDAATALVRAVEADQAAARARAEDAARALARGEELRGQGLLPQADFDGLRAAADAASAQADAAGRRAAQARAQLARAVDLLGKTEIASPLDGTVTRLPVREGEMVVIGIQNMPGTTIMTISDLAVINAEVKVAEAEILNVRVGQPATVTLEALPGREFAGEVVEVGASALPLVGAGAAAREFKVKVRVKDPQEGLRPGLTGDAEILVGEAKDALAVPLQAVVLRGEAGRERPGVFVGEGKTASFVPVETGMIGGLEIEVKKGLEEGREIVAGPWQSLKDLQDGAAIRTARK